MLKIYKNTFLILLGINILQAIVDFFILDNVRVPELHQIILVSLTGLIWLFVSFRLFVPAYWLACLASLAFMYFQFNLFSHLKEFPSPSIISVIFTTGYWLGVCSLPLFGLFAYILYAEYLKRIMTTAKKLGLK